LNKDRDKANTKKNSSSTNYDDIFKIEEMIDKILLKNKDKLERIQSKEIDVENFSLKNKTGNTLYYLRKKTGKKNKDSTDSEVLNEKIISEARVDFGEDSLRPEEKAEQPDNISEEKTSKRHKKRIKFGKKNKKVDDANIAKPSTTENLVKSEEFDEAISELDKILQNKIPIQTDESSKIIDEKIMETPEIDDLSEDKDVVAAKAAELAEKHDFFSKREKSDIGDKKDIDWLSASTDDLAELKKKYKDNLTITDLDSTETSKLDKDELGLLDKKIDDVPIVKDRDDKKGVTR